MTLRRETLRLRMFEAGLWRDRRQRRKRVHQPRCRRDYVGELVQVDGCGHWWFQDRGPQCALLVFIDDATGRGETDCAKEITVMTVNIDSQSVVLATSAHFTTKTKRHQPRRCRLGNTREW